MIVLDPRKYGYDQTAANEKAFYTKILTSLGVSVRSVEVQPMSCKASFARTLAGPAPAESDFYFDIGNPSVGPFAVSGVASYSNKSFYDGQLILTSWVSGQNFNPTYTVTEYLATGPLNALTHFMYRRRSGMTDNDGIVNASTQFGVGTQGVYINQNQFDVLFNLIRMKIELTVAVDAARNVTCNIDILYKGRRIDYS